MPDINKCNTTAAKIFYEVAKNVEIFGEQHTHDLLFRERTQSIRTKYMSYVIELVCTAMSLSEEQIVLDKGRRNNKRVIAMKIISYYSYEMFNQFGITYEVIAERLKRKKVTIAKHHAELVELRKYKTKSAEFYNRIFNDLDTKVKIFIVKQRKQEKQRTHTKK